MDNRITQTLQRILVWIKLYHFALLSVNTFVFVCYNGSMPSRNKLTAKQVKFIKHYIENGNGTEAILASYNTKNRKHAREMAFSYKKKPLVAKAIEKALTKAGLTIDAIAENISQMANHEPDKIPADVVLRANAMAFDMHLRADKLAENQTFKAKITKLNSKELLLELKKVASEASTLVDNFEGSAFESYDNHITTEDMEEVQEEKRITTG